MRIYRNEQVERIAERRLTEYEAFAGEPLQLPIPIDKLAEHVLGLDLLYEEIEELPGEVVLGGLRPRDRLIVLNDRHRALFDEKPGLERSTKGHEMGHWDLFVDRSTLDNPFLPGFDVADGFTVRRSTSGQVVILPSLLQDPLIRDLIVQIQSRADEPHEARAVNRYAAAISMPRSLIRQAVQNVDRSQWANLYRVAEQFDVTITALKVRLEQLGLLHVQDKQHVYRTKAEGIGQASLFDQLEDVTSRGDSRDRPT
ncbi:MAG TPA: hypothetical protein VMW65_08710 [Chloroflexota bacterium]|nr:hypothetical protein [Chloroflexota bacterium]